MKHLRPVCVAGAVLRATSDAPPCLAWQAQHLGHLTPQARSAQKAQHLEHLRLVSRGRRSTWRRSEEVWRHLMRMGAASFCVAGAALGALQACFAWQAQHLEHCHKGRRKSGDEQCAWASRRFAWQAQHLEHFRHVFAWQGQHIEHCHRARRKSGDK